MRHVCKKKVHIWKEYPAKSQQSSKYELSLFLNRRVIAYIGWMSRVCRDGDDKEGWKKAEERLSSGRQLYPDSGEVPWGARARAIGRPRGGIHGLGLLHGIRASVRSVVLEPDVSHIGCFARPHRRVLDEGDTTSLGRDSALNHEGVLAADRHVRDDELALFVRGDPTQAETEVTTRQRVSPDQAPETELPSGSRIRPVSAASGSRVTTTGPSVSSRS